MLKTLVDHNAAKGARRSCLGTVTMASKTQGAYRDCPVRLRLKYRVHAPEKGEGTLCPQPI
jgi:hypothetical protein